VSSAVPALCIRGLTVRYGGVVAVQDVDLVVPPSTLVGLIGPNGAGKTTLIDAVTGFVRYSGEIEMDGRPLESLKTHERSRAGLARSFQSVELWDDLSVFDNLRAAAAVGGLLGSMLPWSRVHAEKVELSERVLHAFELDHVRSVRVSELSHGWRKHVSLARAFVAGPRVALLDEPLAGVDRVKSQWIGDRLRRLADDGAALLLIDHDVASILRICDVVYVLDFGKVIAVGPPDEIRVNPRVVQAYLGADVAVGAGA
jgi:ABC-type branched-subunit amino acid transport system ATPase component